MRSLGIKLLAFAAAVAIAAPVFAQTDTYGAKADVVMELRPSKFHDSPLGKMLDFKGQMAALAGKAGPDKPDFSKVERVFAGMVAPESMQDLNKIQQGEDNKIEFFVRLEFVSAEASAKLLANADKSAWEAMEKNGKTYYKAPAINKGMPEGTVMYNVSDKIVELASPGFAYRSVEVPVTEALGAAWKTMPDEALKVSVDGVSARGLLTSLAEEGKKNAGNPMAAAVMDLFPTMDNVNLSVDLASANLLTMEMVGSDESAASEINDGFKSMVSLAKPAGTAGLAVLEADAPEAAAVFGKVVNGMDVKQKGKNVTLNVPRPEGFETATAKVLPMVMGIAPGLMGGGRPAGPPPGSGY